MNAVVQQLETMPVAVTPMQMLQIAVSQGADLDRIQKLMDLQDRWEAAEARKAFVSAMSAFKSEPVTIQKTKWVDVPGGAKFYHATLSDCVAAAAPAMAKHGLSHKWETKQDAGMITVTCIITHAMGHNERVTLAAPPDSSGKKNSIQEIASTVSYLERYTFLAATGLAAKDMDNDGKDAGKAAVKPSAPEGYEPWKADMNAVAEEGKARHLEAWKNSKPEYRAYATTHDLDWWETSKRKASKVQA